MNQSISGGSPAKLLALLVLCLAPLCTAPAQTGVFGVFNYTDNGVEITIDGLTKPVKGNLVIPAQIKGMPVTGISAFAFYQNASFTSVSIPETVLSIPVGAFSQCFNLASFSVSPANPLFKSVDGVLYNFDGTTLLAYPAARPANFFGVPFGVTAIADFAFYGAFRLRTVFFPQGLEDIGASAFAYCYSLEEVGVIPDSVTLIRNDAFLGSPKISGFGVAPGNPNYATVDEVLFNQTLTELIKFPSGSPLTSYAIPPGTTTVRSYAFENCTNLRELTVPASVTLLELRAFIECRNLVAFTVDGGNAEYFSENGVIFDEAKQTLLFYPSGKAGAYVVPAGVIEIGSAAFEFAGRLTSLTLADSTTSFFIGDLSGNKELAEVIAPPGNIAYDSEGGILYFQTGGIALVPPGLFGHVEIRDGETKIDDWVFFDSGITSVRIPASVTEIGSNAFYASRNLSSAEFAGNAPSVSEDVFGQTARGFTVRYLDGSTGFSSPRWRGYPAVKLNSFPPTQYPVRAATYVGLTPADTPTTGNATEMTAFWQRTGQLSVTTRADRSFSGTLLLEGQRLPLKGMFNGTTGNATLSLVRPGKGNATLSLQYLGAGRGIIAATLTASQGPMIFTLNPTVGRPGGNDHPLTNERYTVLLSRSAPSVGVEPGQGYATVVISKDGQATIAGRLADGSKAFALRVPIVNDGTDAWSLPVHAPLYARSSGFLSGIWEIPQIETPAVRNLTGYLTWLRPADSKSSFAPAGFVWQLGAEGESYFPMAGVSLFDGSTDTASFLLEIDPDSNILPAPFTQSGNWSAANVATLSAPVPKGMTFRFNLKTGVITGTFPRTVGSTTVNTAFQGVIFDDSIFSDKGGGFFTTGNGSGSFILR